MNSVSLGSLPCGYDCLNGDNQEERCHSLIHLIFNRWISHLFRNKIDSAPVIRSLQEIHDNWLLLGSKCFSSFLCCLLCYFSIFEPPGKQKKEGLHPGWLILNYGYNLSNLHFPGFTCSPIWTEHWLCFLIFLNMWVVASTLTLIGCSLIFLIKTLFIYTPYTSDCSHLECFFLSFSLLFGSYW